MQEVLDLYTQAFKKKKNAPTLERISKTLFIDYEHYTNTPTIFLSEKSLIVFCVCQTHHLHEFTPLW
jgi:hypothetical protein